MSRINETYTSSSGRKLHNFRAIHRIISWESVSLTFESKCIFIKESVLFIINYILLLLFRSIFFICNYFRVKKTYTNNSNLVPC